MGSLVSRPTPDACRVAFVASRKTGSSVSPAALPGTAASVAATSAQVAQAVELLEREWGGNPRAK